MKKLCLIGCGGIGAYHFEHFLKFGDVDLAGFCDLVIERAESFVRRAGRGKAYSDFRKMYDEVKPDMVFICIPPNCHGDIEFETIRREIPFFVEKPIALDMDLAGEMVRQAESKKLITAVGFQCRYDNINDQVKDYIAKNRIVTAAASRVGGIPDAPWWKIKSASGGQLVEQTIHQIDMLRYLMNCEADTVYTVASRGIITQKECPGYFTDDLTTSLITFKNGVTCTMMTGCYSTNGASWDSRMSFGARASRADYVLCVSSAIYGLAEGDKARAAAGTIAGDGTQRKNEGETGIVVKSSVDFGVLCDRTFVDAVLSGDPSGIRSPYADALKTLAIVLACNRSIETGVPEKVSV
jgi:predicted dehydrogenase